MGKWLLPEDLADILPAEARRLEELRRRLLDLYRTSGYELVMPPLLEYPESLLSGTGADLRASTFLLMDPHDGRQLGLRADMTPQVTRIDAHLLNRQGVTRLCYCGPVLLTRAAGFWATREPLQVGAEIYGHAGLEADLECIELALQSLSAVGLPRVRIDLFHPGVMHALLEGVPPELNADLTAALRAKDLAAIAHLSRDLAPALQAGLLALPTLCGPAHEVLERARAVLSAGPAVSGALETLQRLVEQLGIDPQPDIDLADAGGYAYHSGIMFAVYHTGWPNALVRGGRYDGVGKAFGRSRPATGFSLDLRELTGLLEPALPGEAIEAPWGRAPDLLAAIAALRAQGRVVVQSLPGAASDPDEYRLTARLTQAAEGWVVVSKEF